MCMGPCALFFSLLLAWLSKRERERAFARPQKACAVCIHSTVRVEEHIHRTMYGIFLFLFALRCTFFSRSFIVWCPFPILSPLVHGNETSIKSYPSRITIQQYFNGNVSYKRLMCFSFMVYSVLLLLLFALFLVLAPHTIYPILVRW